MPGRNGELELGIPEFRELFFFHFMSFCFLNAERTAKQMRILPAGTGWPDFKASACSRSGGRFPILVVNSEVFSTSLPPRPAAVQWRRRVVRGR